MYSVISGGRKGYSRHPETLRWERRPDILTARHDLTVKEMILRGFNHASPLITSDIKELNKNDKLTYVDKPSRQFELLKQKYMLKGQRGRIPLPENSTDFWSNYKYSVMARGYQYCQEMKQFLNTCFRHKKSTQYGS